MSDPAKALVEEAWRRENEQLKSRLDTINVLLMETLKQTGHAISRGGVDLREILEKVRRIRDRPVSRN